MEDNRNKGFTLLEILVALALLSILAAALYGTYFGLMRARETATAGMELRRELRTSLDMIRREIASAFFTRNNERLHFIVEDRDVFGKPGSTLNLTTLSLSGGDASPGSDLVEVKYGLIEREGKMILTRRVRDVYLATNSPPYPQMEGLEGFLLECLDNGIWVKSWDTALNGKLPKAVRVTIRIKEGDKTEEFFAVFFSQGDGKLKGEGGFALIITLIVTALLAALAMEFINQVYVDTSARHNFVDGQQASLLAQAGIQGGLRLLKKTLSEQSYTSLRDSWAKPLEIEDPTGIIRVTIEEESGKLNLNQLVLPNGLYFEPFAGMARRVFKKLGLSADLLEALADWLDENEEPRSGGAESSYYAGLSPPYKAKNKSLETLEELRLVKGFIGGPLGKLRPLVTIYADNPLAPSNGININTAPREIIASLDERMTDRLTEGVTDYRLIHPFADPTDLAKVPGMETLAIRLLGKIQVKGSVFRIRSEGMVNKINRTIEAVVRWADNQPTFLYWREF